MKVKVTISMGLVGCRLSDTIVVDDEEWAAMSEDAREDYCKDIAFANVDWNWSEIE